MPIDVNIKVIEPEGSEWKPVVPDVYQVQIMDLKIVEGKKFQSDETQEQIMFKLAILDTDQKGQRVTAWSTIRWFKGGKNASPSKLFTIIKAVYAFYFPDVVMNDFKVEDVTKEMLNDLIGKQIRVTVELNVDETGNKVTGFMPIKTELPKLDTKTEDPGEVTDEDLEGKKKEE